MNVLLLIFLIPPFFEFDWKNKIESIFILNKDGICLYNHSFTDVAKVLDKQFISGTITSMNIMLKELIYGSNNEILVLRKRGKITNIFLGDHITGVLISKEELNFFKYNLKRLVLKVEDIIGFKVQAIANEFYCREFVWAIDSLSALF